MFWWPAKREEIDSLNREKDALISEKNRLEARCQRLESKISAVGEDRDAAAIENEELLGMVAVSDNETQELAQLKVKHAQLSKKYVKLSEKAQEAFQVLEKISQPPHEYATVLDIGDGAVDVVLNNGRRYAVTFDPDLVLERGLRVRLMPETMAVVAQNGMAQGKFVAVVKDLVDELYRVEIKGQEIVVPAICEDVRLGDDVLLDEGSNLILQNLGKSGRAYKLEEVPEMPWSAIGGLDDVIEDLRSNIERPLRQRGDYAELGKSPPKGVLLYGPPGCGKTMIGKALAFNLAELMKELKGSEAEGHFLYAAGPEFLRWFVGAGEHKVRGLFGYARELSKDGNPVTIFIDEAEAIFKKRGTGISTDATDSILNQFLTEMDGLNSSDNIIVALATNREDVLDPAVTRSGRVDRRVKIPRPDRDGAKAIFGIYLSSVPLDGELAEYVEHAVTEVFDGSLPILEITNTEEKGYVEFQHVFSGAAVKGIVDRVTTYVLDHREERGKLVATKDDISRAVEAEYHEIRAFPQVITDDDVRNAVGRDFGHITDITAPYASSSFNQRLLHPRVGRR